MTVQMLTFGPNFCFLDSVSGFIQMRSRTLLTINMILTSTLARLRIMPKPIGATLLIGFQVFYINTLEVSCAFSFTLPPVTAKA